MPVRKAEVCCTAMQMGIMEGSLPAAWPGSMAGSWNHTSLSGKSPRLRRALPALPGWSCTCDAADVI